MADCQINCTSWALSIEKLIEPDPDIAGIGVIMTFVVSAFLVLLLCLANLILTASITSATNSIDHWVFKLMRHIPHMTLSHQRRDFWVQVIEKVTLNLSDQQLLTGVAILVASFWTHCTISVYHFTLASDLAWFSSNTHITSLRVLGGYLRRHHILKNWRVIVMICMAVLLAASSVLQGHSSWYDSWPYNAQCLFDNLPGNVGGPPAFFMGLNLFFILLFYPLTMILLYEKPSKALTKWLYENPRAFLANKIEERKIRKAQLLRDDHPHSRLLYAGLWLNIRILCIVRVIHLALAACCVSAVVNLSMDALWFAYGLYGLVGDRRISPADMGGTENKMSFGQIVPILLLSSTIFVIREAYDDEREKLTNGIKQQNLDPVGSQTSLVSHANTHRTTPQPEVPIEMSSALTSADDTSKFPLGYPRRVDTEMGGGSLASGHEDNVETISLQRRPTFPPRENLASE